MAKEEAWVKDPLPIYVHDISSISPIISPCISGKGKGKGKGKSQNENMIGGSERISIGENVFGYFEVGCVIWARKKVGKGSLTHASP